MTEAQRLVEQFRREARSQERANAEVPVAGTRVKVALPGRTIHTVYYSAGRKNAPVIFAFHGGGFVFGGCALDDALHHTLSKELSADVISIGYRKGEDNPFPRAVDDAYDTAKHYLDKLEGEFDFDRNRVATFGSSAGANLAATTSILAHRRREFTVGVQVLNYPFLDMATPPEQKGYAPDELVRMHFFNSAYARPEQWTDPLVSPILAADEDFDRDMKAIITLAEIDPLRTEGESYAERLRTLGLEVAEHVAANQGHAYLELGFRNLSQGYVPPLVEAAARNGSLYSERDETIAFIKKQWDRWMPD